MMRYGRGNSNPNDKENKVNIHPRADAFFLGPRSESLYCQYNFEDVGSNFLITTENAFSHNFLLQAHKKAR